MAKRSINFGTKTLDISYEIKNDSKRAIVFLHGWGSNKNLMKQAFGSHLPNYSHIYIDLPGFGESPNDEFVLNTSDYANIIQAFLDSIKRDFELEICAIIGHSFGGKVAALLNPPNLILLSSAGILEPKPLAVRLKIALAKIAKFLHISPAKLRAKDAHNLSQNMYETFKIVVNEDFAPIFEKFKNPALIFWGKDDTATTLKSGKKIASLMANLCDFVEMDGGHYFFLSAPNAQKIAQKITEKMG